MSKILVIDDSQLVQATLQDLLSVDHEVFSTLTGEEGVAAATDHLPDLVLLDIHLPGIDGYQVCRILKQYETTMDIPVLFITGNDSPLERDRGFAAGGDDYIVKPFSAKELQARVKAHLASREVKRQTLELERLRVAREVTKTVAQELSDPLAAALASVFLLEQQPDDAAGENLRLLRNSLESMDSIIRKLPLQV